MRESDFEGSYGSRAMSFRSWGASYHTLELRIAPTDCAMALGEQATVIGITSEDAPLVASARLYLHAIHSRKDVTTTAGLAGAYFLQLRSRGILAADLAATITLDERVRGIAWSAFRPLIESLGRGAKRTDLAPRNHALLVRTALSFGLGWLGGWRDITVCYRVRVATLLLSSPALSIGEVADAVGYTSVEALAHALRAYELPSASEIRRELGAEETPTSTASVA